MCSLVETRVANDRIGGILFRSEHVWMAAN